MLNRRSLIAAAVALAMPAALPALASAASVSADSAGAITLRDAGSETNAVTLTLDAPTRNWVVSDSATPLTAGAGCTQSTANEVRCAQTSARPTAYLGGGDDTFMAPDDGGWIVYGEAGSDRLAGGAGADTFFGGPGADTLTGAGGNDRLDGETGDDTIDGGAGEDLITYTSATGPVTVDLTAGTGGQAGEHDVLTGIEDVTAIGTLIGDDGRTSSRAAATTTSSPATAATTRSSAKRAATPSTAAPATTASTATPRSAAATAPTTSTAATATTSSTAATAPATRSAAARATTSSAAAATGTPA